MKASVLMLAWLLLSSGTTPPEPPQTNQARLVIYRLREFGGNAYDIKVNDQKAGPLPTNRYLQLDVPPGPVKIESVKNYFSENQTVQLDARPGRTYYVKAVEEMDFLTSALLLAPVREEQGQREAQGLKPVAQSRAN
jgi:hypothetical protein